jgi:hypothetical protein
VLLSNFLRDYHTGNIILALSRLTGGRFAA